MPSALQTDPQFRAVGSVTSHTGPVLTYRYRTSKTITKSASGVVAAGLVVRAADTGRILMLQRASNVGTVPAGDDQLYALAPTDLNLYGVLPGPTSKGGPKGYIHGWIYVGPHPSVGQLIHQIKKDRKGNVVSDRHGSISRITDGHVHVTWNDGKKNVVEHVTHGWVRGDAAGHAADDVLASLDSLPSGHDVYYHGSRAEISDLGKQEIFLSPDKHAALGYLQRRPGNVYAVRLDPSARIARDDELHSAAEKVWGNVDDHFGYRPYTYELADSAQVRQQLARDGFVGARFKDLGPDNAYDHDTTVVWDSKAMSIVGHKAVPAVVDDEQLTTTKSAANVGTHHDLVERSKLGQAEKPQVSAKPASAGRKPAAPKKPSVEPSGGGVPKYQPPTSLTVAEQKRAERLVRADPQIIAGVQDRFGDVSRSGNLSSEDAAWLQSVYEREPAFVNRLAQTAQIERRIKKNAKKAGLTPAAYKRQVAGKLKSLVHDKPVVVRVTDDAALRGILSEGRFRTQFDAGTKRAPGLSVGVDRRRLGEQISGVAPDAPAAQRPVYGYVAVNGVEPALSGGKKTPGIAEHEGQEDLLSAYGKVQVVLKPQVRQRTSMTIGDSLDDIGFMRPSPIDAPSAESAGLYDLHDLDDVSSPGWTRRNYVEAQIHGGIVPADIAEVVFPEKPDARTISALHAEGIPWRVLTPGDAPVEKSAKKVTAAAAGLAALHVDLTPLQVAAVDKYQGDGSYNINAALRQGAGATSSLRLKHQPVVEQLDTVMRSASLPVPVTVYRDVVGEKVWGGLVNADMTGTVWLDHGFVSTSAHPRNPKWNATTMRITVPAGTHGFSDPRLDNNEILLNRGLTFRVVKDNGTTSGIRNLDVEVVPL